MNIILLALPIGFLIYMIWLFFNLGKTNEMDKMYEKRSQSLLDLKNALEEAQQVRDQELEQAREQFEDSVYPIILNNEQRDSLKNVLIPFLNTDMELSSKWSTMVQNILDRGRYSEMEKRELNKLREVYKEQTND